MSNELSQQYKQALELHNKILVSAQLAQNNLLDMCTALKEMRDGKLYKELGYQNFEDYCGAEFNMSRANASKYISILENIKDVSPVKHLGVSKLYLLSTLSESEQQEIIDNNDMDSITRKELEAQVRKLKEENEELEKAVDKLGKKTGSQISPLVKEWADMVLFANYKTVAVQADKEGNKFKAQGGERVMYTEHHPCWDAKNRHGLAALLPFDYAQIAHIFSTVQPVVQQPAPVAAPPVQPAPVNAEIEKIVDEPPASAFSEAPPAVNIPDALPKALADLMLQNGVDEKEIRLAVSQRGYFPFDMPIANYPPDFISGVLIGAWEQVFGMIVTNRDLPF